MYGELSEQRKFQAFTQGTYCWKTIMYLKEKVSLTNEVVNNFCEKGW